VNEQRDNHQPVILLTGVSGQVGWELQRTLAPVGLVVPCGIERMPLDQPDRVRAVVREVAPDIIVNPAAHTAVDQAEDERDLAATINGIAPGILAEEAAQLGAAMVHYSTDYVFDGQQDRPYREDDEPNPTGVYGETKLAGERAVLAANPASLILRTSWVYGLRGRNFLITMRRLARERQTLSIVDDQIGAPTWSRMLAEATAQIITRCLAAGSPRDGVAAYAGLYHLTCAGQTSWCGFARRILELDQAEGLAEITGIPSSAYPTKAKRPAYSVLDGGKLRERFGIALPGWDEALRLVMDDASCADGKTSPPA
jgi:dTDP-4-dehydrorhamnose reductase